MKRFFEKSYPKSVSILRNDGYESVVCS